MDFHSLQNIRFNKLEREIGERWWNSSKLEVEVGVQVTNLFRGAFLKLGVKDESNV